VSDACGAMRVALSARMDGEPLGLSAAALDDHLRTCPSCQSWAADAERLTRAVRVSAANVPDLSTRILADVEVPARRARRPVTLLRIFLFLVGVLQFALTMPGLFGESVGMHMGEHAAHESAAWNAALGAAFVVTAIRPRLAAGLLPLLGVFVVLLAALSAYDVSTGAVDATRLLSHGGCVLGLIILAALARLTHERPHPIVFAGGVDAADAADRPRLRGVA
jgi:predicted anti-sigma-YlaC factor YlaD